MKGQKNKEESEKSAQRSKQVRIAEWIKTKDIKLRIKHDFNRPFKKLSRRKKERKMTKLKSVFPYILPICAQETKKKKSHVKTKCILNLAHCQHDS